MKEMEPLISVIVPVYNMERYLARCIDSILANTYQSLEILCIDDGSTDRSLEILRQYEAADSRILVIAKENGGVSSARNAGLDRMSGEFVTFLDSDDFIHPQYFSLFMQAQRETNADFIIGQYQKVTDDDLPVQYSSIPFAAEALRILDCKSLFRNVEFRRYCTIRLIRASKIGSLRFRTDMCYGEDTTFIAELWERNMDMTACAFPYAVYYYYERNASASNSAKWAEKLQMLSLFSTKAKRSEAHEIIYLDHVIRFALSSRDLALYIFPNREFVRDSSSLLRRQLIPLLRSSNYTVKEKLALSGFILLPHSHWKYRISKDNSLHNWEIAEKQRRKAIKHNKQTP